jgi:hypothetical protein
MAGYLYDSVPVGIGLHDRHDADAFSYLCSDTTEIAGESLEVDFCHGGASWLGHSASSNQLDDGCVAWSRKVGMNIPLPALNVNASGLTRVFPRRIKKPIKRTRWVQVRIR